MGHLHGDNNLTDFVDNQLNNIFNFVQFTQQRTNGDRNVSPVVYARLAQEKNEITNPWGSKTLGPLDDAPGGYYISRCRVR